MARHMTSDEIRALQSATKGRASFYPWEQWTDGEWWLCEEGVDYECTTASFRGAVYSHARRRGLNVRIIGGDAHVSFRFGAHPLTYEQTGLSGGVRDDGSTALDTPVYVRKTRTSKGVDTDKRAHGVDALLNKYGPPPEDLDD